MKTLVPRSIKLGLILATFSMVAMAQSLNTFTCGPTTIAAGASFRCTVGITSAASIAGVTIKMSTIAGVNSPATVTIPWLQTTAIFTITTSASLTPQIAPMTATLGAISRSSPVTVASTVPYTITALWCSPGKIIPSQTASCTGSLSAEAPAGGLVATLTSSSAHLPVPSSVSIPAAATAFQFKATASSVTTALEAITITAEVKSSNRSLTVTIDPSPKFYLKGTNEELSLLTNGASVTPSAGPAGWLGLLTVRGAGFMAFDPSATSGISFHQNGGQNSNTAFVNFSGAACAQVFGNSSEISFNLKSAHSFSERKLLPAPNMRGVFEVFDSYGPMYFFSTSTTSTGTLQFNYGSGGSSTVYTVPAGQEDVVFGKDVVARIKIKWTTTSYSLYVNGALAQTNPIAGRGATWSATSAFTIGSRSARIAGGGYYSSDDRIAEFVVR